MRLLALLLGSHRTIKKRKTAYCRYMHHVNTLKRYTKVIDLKFKTEINFILVKHLQSGIKKHHTLVLPKVARWAYKASIQYTKTL